MTAHSDSGWMTADDYFAMRDAEAAAAGPDLSPDNVARAVRFMQAWAPIGAQGMGLAAAGDLEVLVAYAQQQLGLAD